MRGQLYHGHYLIISPLHGHGEVANENSLILSRTLSIVGALVLLKRRAGIWTIHIYKKKIKRCYHSRNWQRVPWYPGWQWPFSLCSFLLEGTSMQEAWVKLKDLLQNSSLIFTALPWKHNFFFFLFYKQSDDRGSLRLRANNKAKRLHRSLIRQWSFMRFHYFTQRVDC